MVGIEGHTKNVDQTEAYKSSLFAVRGMGHFLDSQGSAWLQPISTKVAMGVVGCCWGGARQTYETLIKLAPMKEPKTLVVSAHPGDFPYPDVHES